MCRRDFGGDAAVRSEPAHLPGSACSQAIASGARGRDGVYNQKAHVTKASWKGQSNQIVSLGSHTLGMYTRLTRIAGHHQSAS